MNSDAETNPYEEFVTKTLSLRESRSAYLGEIPDLVEPVFAGARIVEFKRVYTYPLHRHAEYEVLYVDHGLYRCRHNALLQEVGKDNVIILKPGDSHQDFCTPGLKYFTTKFFLRTPLRPDHKAALFKDGVDVRQQTFKVRRQWLLPLVRKIHEESRINDSVSRHIQRCLVREFFWRLVRALPRQIISDELVCVFREQKFVANLFQVFDEHLTSHLTVPDMAALMRMSESALAHACSEALHSGPSRLFVQTKMRYALDILQQTSMSVKEISDFLGFQNPYHFSRVFKSVHGKSPVQCRGTAGRGIFSAERDIAPRDSQGG